MRGAAGREAEQGEGSRQLPVHLLILLTSLAAGVVAQGGFYPQGQLTIGALILTSLALAMWNPRWSLRDFLAAPVPALLALASWVAARGAIAGDAAAATGVVALILGVGVCLTLCRQEQELGEVLASGLITLGVVVAATGWVGVAFRFEPWALVHGGLWRASSTLTYANAAAAFMVPLCLIALALLSQRPVSTQTLLAVQILLVGTGATLSRFGLLALLVGGLVLTVGLGLRRIAKVALAPVAGAGVALAGLAPSFPEGAQARPGLALAALLAGIAGTMVLSRARGRLLVLAGAALLGGIVLISLVSAPFRSGAATVVESRMTLASQDRVDEAKAALELASTDPMIGVGPGAAELSWIGPQGPRIASYVHNEYLQVLTEYGMVGLALLLGAVAGVARSLWRSRSLVHPREMWVGGVAALVAYALHSASDFLWHIPVTPLAMALTLGIITPIPRKIVPAKEDS